MESNSKNIFRNSAGQRRVLNAPRRRQWAAARANDTFRVNLVSGPGPYPTTSTDTSLRRRLGSDVFQQLYENLKEAGRRRQRQGLGGEEEEGEEEKALRRLGDEGDVCVQVDQLLFCEEELKKLRRQRDDDEAPV
ncbi:hypothetical protein INR49_007950 [Caranx melampygus]|nr:hypothetical protein INR49_007950 [Caranx melampygus]